MSRRAKILTNDELNRLLEAVQYNSLDPLRDYTVIALSFKGGLRVGEIAGLEWRDVLDASGKLSKFIEIPQQIAKGHRSRRVPMHDLVKASLLWLITRDFAGKTPSGPVIKSIKDQRQAISPNALQRYLSRLYRQMGFDCTSHSGRRSAITSLARMANSHECSIYDVQRFAGHSDISTTEAYVDPSDKLVDLVRAL
jgi:integrase/recombinase XerC